MSATILNLIKIDITVAILTEPCYHSVALQSKAGTH